MVRGNLACSWKSSGVLESSVRNTAEQINKKTIFRGDRLCSHHKEKTPSLSGGSARLTRWRRRKAASQMMTSFWLGRLIDGKGVDGFPRDRKHWTGRRLA